MIFVIAAAGRLSALQPDVAKCPAVELRSLEQRRELGAEVIVTKPASIRGERVRESAKPSGSARTVWLVTAAGPVLGSMDTPDLKLHTSCAGNHLEIRASAVRSADYHGAVLKYAPWRPLLLAQVAASSGTTVTVVWRLFSTSGVELHQSDLPAGPQTAFPVVTTGTLQ